MYLYVLKQIFEIFFIYTYIFLQELKTITSQTICNDMASSQSWKSLIGKNIVIYKKCEHYVRIMCFSDIYISPIIEKITSQTICNDMMSPQVEKHWLKNI